MRCRCPMPWSQTTPMHQRTLFIADHLPGTRSVTELCAEYGISRKTAYKWIDRYIRCGPAGLEDRSRRPRNAPNATAPAIAEPLIGLRRNHATWGAKKLLAVLKRRHPNWLLPKRSAACNLVKRHGLILRKTPRRLIGHPGRPSALILAPKPRLVRGLQGPVPDGQRPLLLSAHRLRRLQPLSARLPRAHHHRGTGFKASILPALPRVRATAIHPHRQRRAICDQHARAALQALGLVGTASVLS